MLFNCVVIIAKKQTAYCNPFRPVETRLNLSKHVSIRSDLSRPVSRLPPLPFSPLLPPPPPFPLSLGGGGGGGREGEGGGETPSPKPPGGGGDEVPPPPPDFNKKLSKFSHSFFSLCNLPLPPRGFSQSTAAAAQNYINTYGGGLSTKNKIHCGILK